MLTMVILVLLGASALKSNTSNVTDYVKTTSASFYQATATPSLPYADGKYLKKQGPKPIAWEKTKERPAGFVLAPSLKKEEKLKMPELVIKLDPDKEVREIDVFSKYDSLDNIGTLRPAQIRKTVDSDEIMSFFTKTIKTEAGGEKTGAIVAPLGTGTGTATESRAELETK